MWYYKCDVFNFLDFCGHFYLRCESGGCAAFLGEGRYEGRYSERNEYCDRTITLDGVCYRAVERNVYDRVRFFLVERHKVRSRDIRRSPSEKVFGELGVLLLRPMNTAAHCLP